MEFFVLAVVRRWLGSDLAPGVVLLAATALALLWVNGPAGHTYATVWELEWGWEAAGLRLDGRHWVNDAVMTVFFFVIGLELKHEVTGGQLAHPRQALVPVLAAAGGAVVPAAVFLAITWGGPAAGGWGIPMATDPAFAVGVLALVARRAPAGVRALLLAIATVDDVLAIGVIAFGYSDGLAWQWLAAAIAGCVVVVLMRRAGVAAIWPYVPVGAVVWYCTLHSGVHATLAGVALALLTPARPVAGRAILRTLLRRLAPMSAFVAVPLFALANAGVHVDLESLVSAAQSQVTWAVFAGLTAGKLLGVAGTIALATTTGLGCLPTGLHTRHVIGLGLIAGLGFTVSLFVTELAYTEPNLTDHAKIGVLAASTVAAITAAIVLATAKPGRRT
jgi:Na+:H+ antiporter, NhaA family